MKPQINSLIKRAGSSLSKKFLTLALAATVLATSAFAGGEEDKARAIKNLRQEFTNAKDIQWKLTSNYMKASFQWNDQQLEVFYNYDGDMIAKSRRIDPANLPIDAQKTIVKKYPGYRFDETIEYNGMEGDHYFYTSMIKENKKVLLQVTPSGDVRVFQQ